MRKLQMIWGFGKKEKKALDMKGSLDMRSNHN